MSRSLSWIDPATLASALAHSGAMPPAAASGVPALRQDPARFHLDPEQPLPSPLLPPPKKASRPVSADGLPIPSGSLHQRLQAYMEWVMETTGCRRLFILDEDGFVLMEADSDPSLVAIASSFINFHERIRSCLGSRSQGSITIDLENEQLLHLLQVDTGLGRYALGFTVPLPVRRSLVRSFQAALARFLQDEPYVPGGLP